MRYISGEDRGQHSLFPQSLDEYISDDNPVRAIEAFVAQLDVLELGFKRAQSAHTGRPGYDPKDLLKLYIYGYINGIRSSRKLEREAGRNIEVLWLLRKLKPDFKTIADFRRDNKRALKKAFREFVCICRDLELFDTNLVAVDGSKFKAFNAKGKNYYPKKLKKLLERVERKIAEYLEEIDENDKDDDSDAGTGGSGDNAEGLSLKEKIELLKERKAQYEALSEELEKNGETQISLTDPDSRLMPGNNRFEISYNVQSTTEAKNKLIIDYKVTNSVSDREQLAVMARRAQRIVKNKDIEILADTGYWDSFQILKCVKAGITPSVPRRDEKTKARQHKVFPKSKFIYEAESDTYQCPAGQTLTYRFSALRKQTGRMMRYYWTTACETCPLLGQCTTNKRKLRRIDRWEHEHVLEEMEQRMKEQPKRYRLRQQLVEHPFGTLKRGMNQRYFLTKRLPSVTAEFSLSALAYNFKRVINILGTQKFIAAVT